MEQKHILMSALSVGIGVGIGLASGQTVNKWTGGSSAANEITQQMMEQGMLSLVVDGKISKVTFDEFPYYLSEQTRVLQTSAAFVYLKKFDFSKHTRNLAPASRTILLSGPAELYQQMLAKALAHYFEAKLLLLDVTDFSLKIQGKYGAATKETSLRRSISETTLGRMSGLFGSLSVLQPLEETKGMRSLQPREETKGTLHRQSSGTDVGSSETNANHAKLRRNASAVVNLDNLATNYTPTNPGTTVHTKTMIAVKYRT